MYLNGITISADPSIVDHVPPGFVGEFHRQTCCIVAFFRSLIRRKLRSTAPDIAFRFTDSLSTKPQLDESLPYLNIPWPFDFRTYVASCDHDRKRQIFDAMQGGLIWLATIARWDTSPILDAASRINAANLCFEGYSRKSWVSPDQQIRARVHFSFELEQVNLEAVFLRNRTTNVLSRKQLGWAVPETDCLHYLLQDGTWLSGRQFQLRSRGYWRHTWTAEV